ncbi:MAG: proton-translocating NADH-quinone oxidoreductase, chain [Planctomycetota bacterium]|nr:proton-translocating NADH-quinone oxidoreductase, chain [Planctomycetota bacterium]
MQQEIDPLKVLSGDMLYIAPEIALTVLGLLVLIYDFAVVRKRPSAERQSRLAWLTLFGVVATFAIQLVMMLPQDWGGFDTANLYFPLFSGTIASDGTSSWMNLTVIGLLGLIVIMSMSWSFTEHWGEYFALLCWAGVGMMFLIASEELLTLFLTLETMTLCLYMVTAFEKTRRRSAEAGLKYFVYGSVSSALFLFGLSLIYGLTGTTRLDAIRFALVSQGGSTGLSGNVAGAMAVLLVLVGFGFKIAAVPFHQWAPDAYEGAPAPVTAWVATGSKIASFVALLKVLGGALGPWAMKGTDVTSHGWIGLVAVISAVTMTYGNFAALAQKNLKRMLAYSSIAHAGYMLVGVLAASVSANQASSTAPVLFYLVVYSLTTVGAFSVAAWLVRDKGTDQIEDLNGLGRRSPLLAVCIVLLMLSLIGMPPLAGFFGKLYMFMESLNAGDKGRLPLTWLVFLGLFNSVVSAFYYVRVLKAMYLREPSGTPLAKAGPTIAIPIVAATVAAVAFGLYPAPLLDAMRHASLTRPGPNTRVGTQADPNWTPAHAAAEQIRKRAEAEANGIRMVPMGGGSAPKAKASPKGETTPPKAPRESGQPKAKQDRESK